MAIPNRRRPEITLEEEKQLIKMAQGGCARSTAAIMSHCESFVVGEAAKVVRATGARTWREDIEQEGRLALLKQLPKYDLNSKARFTSYACMWMRAAMTEKACDCLEIVRLAHDTDAQAAHRDLERGDDPAVVAERHNLSEDRVRSLVRHTVSLKAVTFTGECDGLTGIEIAERLREFEDELLDTDWKTAQYIGLRTVPIPESMRNKIISRWFDGASSYDVELFKQKAEAHLQQILSTLGDA